MDGRHAELDFIDIVKEIIALVTDTDKDSPPTGRFELEPGSSGAQADLLFEQHRNLLVVEVKFFSYSKPTRQDIENAAAHVVKVANSIDSNNVYGLLVTSYFVGRSIKNEVLEKYGVRIWDRNTLFTLVAPFYSIEKRLEDAFYSIYTNYDRISYSYLNEKDEAEAKELFVQRIADYDTTDRYADDLINEVELIDAGKDDGNDKKFEAWCVKVIEYLFKEQITDVTGQSRSENLFRYDAVGRISRRNEFWDELYQDFRSKFIIFEFKNYTNPITQKEIYTTERYLFPKALRSVAVIIARNGEDKNAKLVRNGALRQEGKLILVFSLEEILELIELKKDGDDPNLQIGKKIDDMLISIER